ncbi:hypothetical protein [Streptococcus catagoni]|uniref:hypothetical protein n=1 Tax=Streptococcus catagoni TaxID=2654874 RepID=UPI001409A6E9|nr:hypothetical protein [Streptococcus catagoni]
MSKKNDFSFLDEDIEKRLEKTRVKLPKKSRKNSNKSPVYFWLGAIIIISLLAGLLNTLFRIF